MSIGPLEIAIVVAILLLIFGPKYLPRLGRSLGRGIRQLRGTVERHHEKEDPEELEPPSRRA